MVLLWLFTILTAIAAVLFAVRVGIFLRRCPTLRPGAPAPDDAPLISVVLPARNEAKHIERCVRAVLAQDYPHLELVVIDDGSTDATPEILARLAAEDARVIVVHNN